MFPRLVKPSPARRDEILDAARQLFAEKGYDATTVSDIIARLGVSKGGFYHYFQSKEDLVEALACRFASQTAAQASHILEDDSLDSFSRLDAFLGAMRRHRMDNAVELRSAFEPLFRPENLQLFERTQRAVNEVMLPILVRIIREGVAERTFDTPDPEGAAEVIVHLTASYRPLVGQLYMTRDRAEFALLAKRLEAKVTYLATVMDRILGLPEGSITLFDSRACEMLACTMPGSNDAA